MMIGEKAQTDMGWKGEGPWTFTRLREPHLTAEFDRQSLPKTYEPGVKDRDGREKKAYSVSLQPSPNPDDLSQDRCIVESWEFPGGGMWTFAGVFDGHAGHDTADHTVKYFPPFLKAQLGTTLSSNSSQTGDTKMISNLISDSIRTFDENLTKDLLDLFPGGEASVDKMSDEEIKAIINDGGRNAAIVSRCMRGTTLLIALIDPHYENLWVASLGDCVAILGNTGRINSELNVNYSVMSETHNGNQAIEADRVRFEHPGEEEAVLRNRVLGAIAVTRAIGDHLFKLPKLYTEKVFMNASSGFRIMTPLGLILPRLKTPPYLSNIPEVKHTALGNKTAASPLDLDQRFLILCSDGLVDLYPRYDDWVRTVGTALSQNSDTNIASALLRFVLGGDDEELVSRMLTVEMCERWMDDTTIVILPL